jgi:hypothetical protein
VTPRERRAIVRLAPGAVRYLPASFGKRFARAMAAQALAEPEFEPSLKQWEQIRRIAHRFRRQAPGAHLVLCGTCTPAPQLPFPLPA